MCPVKRANGKITQLLCEKALNNQNRKLYFRETKTICLIRQQKQNKNKSESLVSHI